MKGAWRCVPGSSTQQTAEDRPVCSGKRVCSTCVCHVAVSRYINDVLHDRCGAVHDVLHWSANVLAAVAVCEHEKREVAFYDVGVC